MINLGIEKTMDLHIHKEEKEMYEVLVKNNDNLKNILEEMVADGVDIKRAYQIKGVGFTTIVGNLTRNERKRIGGEQTKLLLSQYNWELQGTPETEDDVIFLICR